MRRQYLESLEPELRESFDKGEMRAAKHKNEASAWFSPVVDSMMRGFLMLADSMSGPNFENQKVIADTGIFDLCDRVLGRIKFEHLDDHQDNHHEGKHDDVRHELLHNRQSHAQVQAMLASKKAILRAKNELRSRLKCAITRCLDAFLEGIMDPSVVMQMLMQLNWDGVAQQMKSCYTMCKSEIQSFTRSKDPLKALYLEEGVSYYRIMIHCKHYDKLNEFIGPALDDINPKIIEFYDTHTAMIEIVRDQRLERVYFQIPSVCLKGGPLDKPEVDLHLHNENNFDREDPDQKNREFVENMCECVETEQFEHAIRKTPLAFTVTKLGLIRSVNFIWTLSMHIIMVNTSYMPSVGFWASSFKDDYQERIWIEQENPVALGYPEDAKFSEYCGDWCDNEFLLTERDIYFFYSVGPVVEHVLRYMSWLNLITCGFRFFAYCWGELPNIVRIQLSEEFFEALDETDDVQEENITDKTAKEDSDALLDIVWIEDHTKRHHAPPPAHSNEEHGHEHKDWESWEMTKCALSQSGFYYELGFVVFPLIAICTDEPLFTFYCLLEILWWEGSKPVVDAIAMNAPKMGQLVILGLLW